MDGTLAVGLRDLLWLISLVGGVTALWSKFRRGAAEVAVWRREMELKVERLDERLTAHKADHESDAAEQKAFRTRVYEWMRRHDRRMDRVMLKLDLTDPDDEA